MRREDLEHEVSKGLDVPFCMDFDNRIAPLGFHDNSNLEGAAPKAAPAVD